MFKNIFVSYQIDKIIEKYFSEFKEKIDTKFTFVVK